MKHFLKQIIKQLKSWAFKLALQLYRASLPFLENLENFNAGAFDDHTGKNKDSYADHCQANNEF